MQVSIRSGLLFSSTVGMLQPLFFHPFAITSAPVPPYSPIPKNIQTFLDNRISAHAMSSFIVFFYTLTSIVLGLDKTIRSKYLSITILPLTEYAA